MTAPARRPGRLALQVVLVDLLVAVVVAVVLPTSNAWSFWAAGSAPGGNGASRTASVGAGAVPVTSATRGAVSVSWAASTLSSGAAVDGYEVRRYDATGQAHTVGASCAGLVTATTCVEDGVPTGRWTWTITPLVATSWRGAESAHSMVRTVDASPPVNAISLTALSGGAALGPAARTVFYRGTLPGSFTLTNAVSDDGGSPASSQTHELGGAAAGWSHSPSTVSTPSGGPFESTAFSWLAATSSSPTEVVTGRDDSGDGAETTLEYVDDRTAPTGSTVGYRNGLQTAGPVRVTTTSGSDDASGVGGGQLQRATADLAGSTCDTFSNFVDIGPASPTSPYADDSVVDRHCYRYRFVVQDRVGNQATATSAATVRLDSSSGPPSLGTAASYSVLGGTGVVGDNVSTVSGDLGVSPSTSVTGFPARNVGGDIHAGDEAAAQAQRDAVLAYADAGRRAPTTPDFSGDLNGRTFLPGVHHSTAAIDLTGTVTLDGDGDPDAVFIFQISAALNAAAISSVTLVNGARASNVYWRVKGAVNIAAGSDFSGRILAAGAITLGSGTRLIGSALSLGTVTVSNINIRFTEARPPVVTIAGGASATTKDPTPTITGTTDADTGTVVRVTIGSQRLTTLSEDGGGWSVTAEALLADTYDVVASVRDASGNTGSASQALAVEVNPAPVDLRTARTYSVLAATAVTSTGQTTMDRDLGVAPGGTISGISPSQVGGATHDGDEAAAQAMRDFDLAYADADGRRASSTFDGVLVGRTFHAGVHHSVAAGSLTGTVTLDAEGDKDAVFIFQYDGALTPAAGSTVLLVNGAQASHVIWQVQGAVSIGAQSHFAGVILTAGAVTLGDGVVLDGAALSHDTVTMAGNTVRTP